jgi:uncharacterized protein DUF2568
MSENRFNLAVRLLLEIAALAFFAVWGWRLHVAVPWRILAAILAPIAAAILWGTVATRRDVVRSTSAPITVSGAVRLSIELLVLGGAALAIYFAGYPLIAGGYAVIVVVQNALSWDRWRRLLASDTRAW